ncbi:MAG: hypothetical protein P8172_00540 [Gammaproteobacteria bacterium]
MSTAARPTVDSDGTLRNPHGIIRRMASLLFLSRLDQSALLQQVPGLRCSGATRSPDAARAAADWLGVSLPQAPAALRWTADSDREMPTSWLACMDPVTMAADMRELHLLDACPGLAPSEADALAETVLPSVRERGLRLHRPGPDRWYLASAESLAFQAASPAVVSAGRIRGELPTGPDATVVAALSNEIQMLWHEHPVNRERAAGGRAPVNAVWIWGGGPAAVAGPAPARPDRLPPLYSRDPLLQGLWSRLGGTIGEPPHPEDLSGLLAGGCVASMDDRDLPDTMARGLSRMRGLRIVTGEGLTAEVPGSMLSVLRRWARRS